jgi:hypothetical protein
MAATAATAAAAATTTAAAARRVYGERMTVIVFGEDDVECAREPVGIMRVTSSDYKCDAAPCSKNLLGSFTATYCGDDSPVANGTWPHPGGITQDAFADENKCSGEPFSVLWMNPAHCGRDGTSVRCIGGIPAVVSWNAGSVACSGEPDRDEMLPTDCQDGGIWSCA